MSFHTSADQRSVLARQWLRPFRQGAEYSCVPEQRRSFRLVHQSHTALCSRMPCYPQKTLAFAQSLTALQQKK